MGALHSVACAILLLPCLFCLQGRRSAYALWGDASRSKPLDIKSSLCIAALEIGIERGTERYSAYAVFPRRGRCIFYVANCRTYSLSTHALWLFPPIVFPTSARFPKVERYLYVFYIVLFYSLEDLMPRSYGRWRARFLDADLFAIGDGYVWRGSRKKGGSYGSITIPFLLRANALCFSWKQVYRPPGDMALISRAYCIFIEMKVSVVGRFIFEWQSCYWPV